ncbi:brahma-associated protein 60 isoform X2 [Brevipalpus obovatus]
MSLNPGMSQPNSKLIMPPPPPPGQRAVFNVPPQGYGPQGAPSPQAHYSRPPQMVQSDRYPMSISQTTVPPQSAGLSPSPSHIRMPPPHGPPFGSPSARPMGAPPGIPGQGMKRPAPNMQSPMQNNPVKGMPGMPIHHPNLSSHLNPSFQQPGTKKKKKLADKILPHKVRDLVPESQAYMDLIAFEKKLDFTITRKRLDIQEALKKPMKQRRKLRIFISNTFFPGKPDADGNEDMSVPSWELRVEGRLLEDPATPKPDQSKNKRKFSSFFKSLVIELDKDLYGPDNHLVEWHRNNVTTETDGFQVKRPGNKNVRCTILLLLDYQPLQFKLDPRLARLLGIHTQTRPAINIALWQYIKTNKLQDPHEREYINFDKYLEQIFSCQRMKFAEIPQRMNGLLHPPDPIIISHTIVVEGSETRKTQCYDIDVEVDDPQKQQMNNFIMSTHNQQDVQNLDNKIHETVEAINQLKNNREFFLSFAKDPQQFIHKWLLSQMRDLKTMTDQVGNPEEERRSHYFFQPWTQEAVCRYFYGKVQLRRAELEQALGIRNA